MNGIKSNEPNLKKKLFYSNIYTIYVWETLKGKVQYIKSIRNYLYIKKENEETNFKNAIKNWF